MDAIECMKTRRSIRSYQSKAVPKEVIEDIVDCGRMAATAINIQPWQFVVVLDSATRKAIADATDHGKYIAEAPVCIAVFCKDGKYYLEDGCAATQNLLNAARAYGLGSCWVAGHKKTYTDNIRTLLGVPEGHILVSMISLGYPAEEPVIEKLPLTQMLHWEKY